MYNMSRVNHKGYFDQMTEDELYALKQELNAQRIKDFKSGKYELAGGVVDPLPADAPQFVKDYYAYYKTPRGYHVDLYDNVDVIPFDKIEQFFKTYLK